MQQRRKSTKVEDKVPKKIQKVESDEVVRNEMIEMATDIIQNLLGQISSVDRIATLRTISSMSYRIASEISAGIVGHFKHGKVQLWWTPIFKEQRKQKRGENKKASAEDNQKELERTAAEKKNCELV